MGQVVLMFTLHFDFLRSARLTQNRCRMSAEQLAGTHPSGTENENLDLVDMMGKRVSGYPPLLLILPDHLDAF
jgi:hypothetical protein